MRDIKSTSISRKMLSCLCSMDLLLTSIWTQSAQHCPYRLDNNTATGVLELMIKRLHFILIRMVTRLIIIRSGPMYIISLTFYTVFYGNFVSSLSGVWYVIWVFERDIYLYSMYVPNKMEYLCNLCSHISTYDNLL